MTEFFILVFSRTHAVITKFHFQFSHFQKHRHKEHYLKYILDFNSTSWEILSFAATKDPYIIKAVQCFLRMKAEPYEIRDPAHFYIPRKKILGFSIKAESVSNQVELSKPLWNSY